MQHVATAFSVEKSSTKASSTILFVQLVQHSSWCEIFQNYFLKLTCGHDQGSLCFPPRQNFVLLLFTLVWIIKVFSFTFSNRVRYLGFHKLNSGRFVFKLKGLPWHKHKIQVQRRSLGQKRLTNFGLTTPLVFWYATLF